MKHVLKFFAIATVMVALSASAFGQATASASATATIVTPITITKDVDMNFGNLYSAAAGTVVLDPAGGRSVTGGVTLAPGGTVTAASFTVGGTADVTYAITLPAGATTISSGANTMTVDTWTSTPLATGTLDATGNETLTVGATLNVGLNQPAGIYVSGTLFDVTVNYN
jgi:hypothetical protein